MESCEVCSRLARKIAEVSDEVFNLLERQKIDRADTAQLTTQVARIRRVGREAVRALEEHHKEHRLHEDPRDQAMAG